MSKAQLNSAEQFNPEEQYVPLLVEHTRVVVAQHAIATAVQAIRCRRTAAAVRRRFGAVESGRRGAVLAAENAY